VTTVASAQELLQHGDLVDVRFLRLSAESLPAPREGFEPDDVEQTIRVQFGTEDHAIEVRVAATVRTRLGDFEATGATQFHVEDDVEYGEEVVAEFAEKVGVMAVYPYLREVIQSMTTRLHEAPVTMPLMRQATLKKIEDES
jgi:hypothetical protein